MAPAKFQIYVDDGLIKPAKTTSKPAKEEKNNELEAPALRFVHESLKPSHKFYVDPGKLYPGGSFGIEFSFEELRFKNLTESRTQIQERRRQEEVFKENEQLKRGYEQMKKENEDQKQKIDFLTQQMQLLMQQQQILQQQLSQQQQQQQSLPPQQSTQQLIQQNSNTIPNGSGTQSNRLSILPQCFQTTQCLEFNETSHTAVQDLWCATISNQTATYNDKLTYPIDQSQYLRDNADSSTPKAKRQDNGNDKRNSIASRRLSRPSLGGSPTLKLSPIVETSRDCNSKSSSSSSGLSATPGTAQKTNQITPAPTLPERPIDPADPTSYNRLLACINEPIARQGVFRYPRNLPKIKPNQTFIRAGHDEYLIDQEISSVNRLYGATLLQDDESNESTMNVVPLKVYCMKIDQPANEWLFYICKELHRRLVKQRCQPDIELSVMNANPAVFYKDGSVLIDEYPGVAPLSRFLDACDSLHKQFPKSVAALITLELLQVIKQIHSCDIIHMSLNINNLFIANNPTKDDITKINDRTSIIKLVGFDRAMDMRLLAEGSKFESKLNDMMICQMHDSKPWSNEIDWFGALDCIHRMFFGEQIEPAKDTQNNSWIIDRTFKGCPTSVWPSLFKELLNMPKPMIDPYIDELSTWVIANVNFVIKEAKILQATLEEYNKSMQPNDTQCN